MPTRRALLKELNNLRWKHGNPFPLHLHEEASAHAQKHAEHLAKTGQFRHTEHHLMDSGHGFNSEILARVDPGLRPEDRAKAAVHLWERSNKSHRQLILNAEWHAAIGEKNGNVVVRLKQKKH